MYLDWIQDDHRGYLDSEAFHSYCLAVRATITGPTTLKQIRERLGDGYRDRWIRDALSSLASIGAINQVRYVFPEQWEPVTVRREAVTKGFNGSVKA